MSSPVGPSSGPLELASEGPKSASANQQLRVDIPLAAGQTSSRLAGELSPVSRRPLGRLDKEAPNGRSLFCIIKTAPKSRPPEQVICVCRPRMGLIRRRERERERERDSFRPTGRGRSSASGGGPWRGSPGEISMTLGPAAGAGSPPGQVLMQSSCGPFGGHYRGHFQRNWITTGPGEAS